MATVPNTAAEVDLKDADKKKKVDVGQIPQWKLMVRRFMRSKLSVGGLIALVIMYLMVIFAEFLAPYPYDQLNSDLQWGSPTQLTFNGGLAVYAKTATLNPETFTWVYETDYSTSYPVKWFTRGYDYKLFGIIPSNIHLFGVDEPASIHIMGTDRQGRDVWSRVLQGGRISLAVGLVGVAVSVVIGALFGTASGYFGGAIDNLMQRLIELIQTFPTIPLWAALAAALPKDMPVVQRFFFITLVLSLITWTGLAREVRGKVLAYRSADYTAAALSAGASHWHIITKHMIPNATSHIIVVATLAVPGTILGETALSFLGLGIAPPAVSWGVLMQEAREVQTITSYPWLFIPVIAVVLAVLCFSFLGDGIRDAADPYS